MTKLAGGDETSIAARGLFALHGRDMKDCYLPARRPSTKSLRRGTTTCTAVSFIVLAFVAYLTFIDRPQVRQTSRTAAPQPSIHLSADAGLFEVHHLPSDLLARLAGDDAARAREELFIVSVAPAENEEPSRMLGTHRVEEDALVFQPRFPLSPGVTYLAQLRAPAGQAIVERFTIPKPEPAERTSIVEVYPTSAELPENQLKFYIHFSKPMSRGQAYRHIQLLKADGKPVDGAYLEIGEELWDASTLRFTLLLEPGRVKRGIKPREEEGPILEEGHKYTLVIDKAWQDAAGFDLAASFRKPFAVLAPDDEPPNTANWNIEPPSTANQHTLTVLFPEPLDRGLLERVVWVETSSGQQVDGTIEIDRHETRWRFKPTRSWDVNASYVLAVERILEDRAGNRLGRKFEVDVFEKIDRQVLPEIVRLPLRVESRP